MADSQRKTANLFDKDNADTQNVYVYTGETTVRYNQNTISIVFPCKASTTYSISKIVSSRFAIGFTNAYPQNGTAAYGIIADDSATTLSITTGVVASHIVIFVSYIPAETRSIQEIVDSIMINEGTALPYEPYWQHSLRKLTTATEAVENPLYSDGSAITAYNIKGNEEHTGTPTPSNPVEVNGVGVRTAQLFDKNDVSSIDGYFNSANTYIRSGTGSKIVYVSCNENQTYTVAKVASNRFYIGYTTETPTIGTEVYSLVSGNESTESLTLTTGSGAKYIVAFVYASSVDTLTFDEICASIMINEGTAKPYEPYGFKIPISSGQQTTNIYLGSTQSNRQIGKITFDGSDDEQWSERQSPANSYVISIPAERVDGICTHLTQVSAAASLVDDTMYVGATAMSMKVGGITSLTDFKAWLADNKPTVWYVLATPQTAVVNEPLMKIGTYADTLSNATSIPTTEGTNSITVDTTVQPTEFTATWTGWHDSSVKEWDGSQWNE